MSMGTEDRVDFFRYCIFISIPLLGSSIILPPSLQVDTLTVALTMALIGILGWGIVDDPQPVPFLWWILGWRTENVRELSDFKISMYYSWLNFKNTERLVFFRKYTSTEIANAIEVCENEVETRDTLKISN